MREDPNPRDDPENFLLMDAAEGADVLPVGRLVLAGDADVVDRRAAPACLITCRNDSNGPTLLFRRARAVGLAIAE